MQPIREVQLVCRLVRHHLLVAILITAASILFCLHHVVSSTLGAIVPTLCEPLEQMNLDIRDLRGKTRGDLCWNNPLSTTVGCVILCNSPPAVRVHLVHGYSVVNYKVHY